MRNGIRKLLKQNIKLVSGPGCPVCVSPQNYIDTACKMSLDNNIIICTYGDMVRVPGSKSSLEKSKSQGGNISVVYSARDAIKIAEQNPTKKIVFLGIGFETTAPATALAVLQAKYQKIDNFYIYSAHKLVMPAMEMLVKSPDIKIDGFLCPGNVSIVIGADAYKPIAKKYNKACVVAGFEPNQILGGLLRIITQIVQNEIKVENIYTAAVSEKGSQAALNAIEDVFDIADTNWRAMGTLPKSGLVLNKNFSDFDALKKLGINEEEEIPIKGCRCGDVIQGKIDPPECPLFSNKCTPYEPIGPCMVSGEGTCAAWFKYL